MLRFKFLASTLPVLLAAVFAGGELWPARRPCILLGETSVQIATSPWQAQSTVSFTTDPAAATVRVRLVERAEEADFAYVDDIEGGEADACEVTPATRWIGIAEPPSAADAVIYLSRDGGADYRIFVQSKHFTPLEAAALIVGANRARPRITAAAL